MDSNQIADYCSELRSMKTKGELGQLIASIVLAYPPRDLQKMQENFSDIVRDFDPEYREKLEEMIATHLQGTYQALRRMHDLKNFVHMGDSLADDAADFWKMVAKQCSSGREEQVRLRFFKFLIAAFCMFVLGHPGHPVGMPFPGGEMVGEIEGLYYCPVRDKADNVVGALCPFCPALQTPDIGYLKPPLKAGNHRKQEFIRNCYEYHNFNG